MKTIREVAVDGLLHERPPASLDDYISTEQWDNLSDAIYNAVWPAMRFNRNFCIVLLLIYVVFLGGCLKLLRDSIVDPYSSFPVGDIVLYAGAGCMTIGVVAHILGGLMGACCVQNLIDRNLIKVEDDFNTNMNMKGISVMIQLEGESENGTSEVVRALYDTSPYFYHHHRHDSVSLSACFHLQYDVIFSVDARMYQQLKEVRNYDEDCSTRGSNIRLRADVDETGGGIEGHSELEHRLSKLEKARDRKLIRSDEYDERRQRILDEFL